jgi:hypothetical protein
MEQYSHDTFTSKEKQLDARLQRENAKSAIKKLIEAQIVEASRLDKEGKISVLGFLTFIKNNPDNSNEIKSWVTQNYADLYLEYEKQNLSVLFSDLSEGFSDQKGLASIMRSYLVPVLKQEHVETNKQTEYNIDLAETEMFEQYHENEKNLKNGLIDVDKRKVYNLDHRIVTKNNVINFPRKTQILTKDQLEELKKGLTRQKVNKDEDFSQAA